MSTPTPRTPGWRSRLYPASPPTYRIGASPQDRRLGRLDRAAPSRAALVAHRQNRLTDLHLWCIVYAVYIGQRGKQRAMTPFVKADARDRMARVQVSDEVWTAFRVGIGPRPLSAALGELVEREVRRQRRRSAGDLEGARLALEDARVLGQELKMLIANLEDLAGSKT